MQIKKIKEVLAERWKFYLVGYVIGYIVPISMDGLQNWTYLFPIKLMSIATALGLGTAFYYGSRQMPVFEIAFRSIKYAVFIVVLFVAVYIIKELVLGLTGYDIMPLIGIP
jgi:hypothetical protein